MVSETALDLTLLKEFIEENLGILIFMGFTSLSIWRMKKYSRVLFILFSSYISLIMAAMLIDYFDKLIVLMLFVYILLSFYYQLLLKVELSRAFINPLFSSKELFDPMLYKIRCEIFANGEKRGEGYLTNWDEVGCFALLDLPTKVDGDFEVVVLHKQHKFTQSAKLASISYNRGVGIRFICDDSKSLFNWVEFYKIINDLGFSVEYMK